MNVCHFYIVLAKSRVEPQSKEASMLFLSKGASNKDENIKMQMFSMKDDKGESSTEHVWKENGFFGDKRTDLTIVKANFPENTLVYSSQGRACNVS